MKNILSLILVVAMALSMGACASADTAKVEASAANKTSAPVQTVATAAPSQEKATVETVKASTTEVAAPIAEEPAEDSVAATISGGGYVVDVVKASIVKDGLGNDVIGIKFKFTNNNSDPIAFVYIAMDTVRQGGKTLSMEGMVTNPEDPSQMGLCQWVSNGQSVDVTYLYPYNSSEDIDFSLTLVKDLNSITPLASGSCTLTLS